MSNFRSAVIGCGRMGAFTSDLMLKWAPSCWHPLSHCEAMIKTQDVDLIAVCDIDAKQVKRAQSHFPGIIGFHNYEDMITNVFPDIIGIATRTPERAKIINFAAKSGVRGLHIEKPLCNRISELELITKIFDAPNLVCTYGALRRYIPIFSHARDLVRSGRFGQLEEIQVCFGSSSLMWAHPHSFDLLSFYADDADITTVSARFKEHGIKRIGAYLDGDPLVESVTIQFANGVTGLISQMGGNDVVLSCRYGSVAVDSGGRRIICRESLNEGDPYWEKRTVDPFSAEYGGTQLAIERLVKGLRGYSNQQAILDKRVILAGHRALFASAQSHLEGGRAICPSNLDPLLGISGKNSHNQYS